MVGSLGHAVRGAEKRKARSVALLHTTGLVIGATLIALALATVGAGLRGAGLTDLLMAFAVASLLIVVAQLAGMRLPESRWQVPEVWRRQIDTSALAFIYGALLGLGIFTAVVVAAFWVFLVLTLLVSPIIAVVGWVLYALARSLGFIVVTARSTPERIFLSHAQRRFLLAFSGAIACWATTVQIIG